MGIGDTVGHKERCTANDVRVAGNGFGEGFTLTSFRGNFMSSLSLVIVVIATDRCKTTSKQVQGLLSNLKSEQCEDNYIDCCLSYRHESSSIDLERGKSTF